MSLRKMTLRTLAHLMAVRASWLHMPQLRRGAPAYRGVTPYSAARCARSGSRCAPCVRHLARPTLAAPFRPNYGCDAVRSPAIVNWWTPNGDYSMTPDTRCLRGRAMLTVRRTDRLPNQPAFRAPDCSHRGSQ